MQALFLVVFLLQFKPVVLETGSFWQVTDFHFDKTYLHPTDKNKICNSQTPFSSTPDKAGKWGNYLCDSPWVLVNSSVFAMKNIEPNPDFIVWTGDDLPHVSNDELSTQEVIDTIRNITELLSSTFPNTTVFPALGNHDYHPKHLMPPKPNDIYTAVGDLWSRWLPNDAVATFKKGGFYTTLVRPGLRLVSLNTVYYYTNDKLTGSLPDPAGQFAWLDDVLTNSSRDSEKVFIIGHVPPGAFERAPGKQWFYPQFNKYYIDMVLKHSGVITGHFLAHQHCDSFKIFYDSQGVPRSSIFLCPAVTPWKTVLPTVGDNNPSIRMYKYDRNTTQVKDVWQYFTNLTQANLMDKPDWVIEYKATDAFGIQDVSPQSLHSLVESFKAPNSGNFRKYYLYNSVSAGGEECDDVCKTGQICGITKIDFDEYDVCLNNGTQPTFTFPASNTTSTPSVASDTGRVKSSAVSTVLLVVFVMYCSF